MPVFERRGGRWVPWGTAAPSGDYITMVPVEGREVLARSRGLDTVVALAPPPGTGIEHVSLGSQDGLDLVEVGWRVPGGAWREWRPAGRPITAMVYCFNPRAELVEVTIPAGIAVEGSALAQGVGGVFMRTLHEGAWLRPDGATDRWRGSSMTGGGPPGPVKL